MSFGAVDAKLKHLVVRIHQAAQKTSYPSSSLTSSTSQTSSSSFFAFAQLADQIVNEGIRHQVLNRTTFPLFLQRIVLQQSQQQSQASSSSTNSSPSTSSVAVKGSWMLALQVLRSPSVDRFKLPRDDSIWPLLKGLAPCDKSKEAVETVCRNVLGKTSKHTLGGRSAASQPSGEQAKRKGSGGGRAPHSL